MSTPDRMPRTAALAVVLALAAGPGAARAQIWEVGPALGVANTRQNAVALGVTVTRNFFTGQVVWFALRGFFDSEMSIHNFKRGLDYEEPDRYWIVDTTLAGHPRLRPEGNTLWQSRGFDIHAATYATIGAWRVDLGGGVAYNGLDDTFGLSTGAVVHFTKDTEMDVESLDWPWSAGGRWRLRLSLALWPFW